MNVLSHFESPAPLPTNPTKAAPGARARSSCSLPLTFLSWPPDLFEYKFVNSRLVNSTFLHNKEGCPLDVTGTGEGAYMVYFVSFLGTLAVLPGNIVSALLMDKIGRLRMLGKGAGGWWCVSELTWGREQGEAVNMLLTSF